MPGSGGYPSRVVWRRPALRWVDLVVLAALVALLYGLLRLGPGLNAPFLPKTAPATVSTDPANLPYYAARSLFWMFAGLVLSFARHAATHASLVRAIVQALAATDDHNLREGFFLDLLRRGFSAEEARRQLETAIDWGRYGELYDYDRDDGELTLEPGAQATL